MAEPIIGLKGMNSNDPTAKVISRIKDLIASGDLIPGDKIPSERTLASDFGIGRTLVREALHKLEFYGIVKTLPQKGSILNGLDLDILDGLLSDVLNIQSYDFFSLVETRIFLEEKAIMLCAERCTDEDIEKIEKAFENFVKHVNTEEHVTYDFAFH